MECFFCNAICRFELSVSICVDLWFRSSCSLVPSAGVHRTRVMFCVVKKPGGMGWSKVMLR